MSVAACFAVSALDSSANPTGPSVASGSASFAAAGNSLTITNSANAIINWQGFSIGINEITRFLQSSAGSAVLNRVIGSGGVIPQSVINGVLQSNGRVFLLNPAGIVVGAGAQIDVAGLVMSSLNLSDQDFLNGRLRFTEVPGAGGINNQGAITTSSGGHVYLVAPDVQNSGIIRAPQGDIILAAGKSAELVSDGSPLVSVRVTADSEQALNVGSLIAESGRIGMFGALVRNAGVAEASGAVMGPGGRIRFVANKDLTLDAGSRTAANGTTGGDVVLQAQTGTTLIAGTVEAKGSSGNGGAVQALGVRVGVIGNGVIDASGDTGGGTVLVGGDAHGANPDVQNALQTYIGPDGVIRADASTTGDGGRIIAWADESTQAYGSFSARGGAQSGNGGFIETSAHTLDASGIRVSASAPNGAPGQWLLDPTDLTIDHYTGGSSLIAGGLFNPTFSATLHDSDINATLNSGTNVTVQTNAAGYGNGDITLLGTAAILNSSGGARSLMLVADRNIVMNTGASISGSAGNSLNVTLNSDRDASGGGSIYMQSGSSIVTNGGNIVMGGGSDPTTTAAIGIVGNPGGPHGVYLSAATVNSGTGNISLIGKGAAGTTTAIGVALDGGAVVSAAGGTISIDATAGSGIDNRGLYMAGSGTTIQSTDGAISIVGHGAAGQSSVGVMLDTGALVKSTGAATITVNGTSVGGTVINNPGVIVSGATVQSLSGSILVKGAGSGTATGAYGIWLQNGAQILSTGSAAIALDGTGSGTSAGIYSDPTGGAKTIGGSSASGAITVTSRANDLSLSNSAIQTQGDVTLTDGQASALTTTGSVSGRNISVVSDQAIFSGTVSGTTSVAYRTANNQAISFAGSFLNNVSTPLMRIGDSAMTSNISLLGAVAPSSISTLSLTTGGTISGTGALTVGALNADGGVVNLSGANSVGVLQARARSGNLFYNGAGTVTLGSVDTASNPVPGVLATGLATIAAGGDIKANFAGAYAVQGGTGAVLSAPHGAIGGATPLEVGAPSLSATAMNGINVDLNQFTPLAAGIGTLQNSGPGDIVLNAWGGMATTTLVSDPGGSVTLQTHSPLAVLGGINSGKSIFLASLGASNNVMVLDGPFTYNKVGGVFEVTIGAGGSLALAATHELLTAEVFPNALDITKFTFLGSALLDPAVNSVVITQTGFKSCKG